MSFKKENPSLCKLLHLYEEKPEAYMDEIDLDSYFYNNSDICQSQNRKVSVTKVS